MSQQFGELAECYWDDAVAGYLGDGPRELARCRNDKSQPWELGRFMGYVWEKDQPFRLILHGESTGSMVVRKFCQIYRAPHPGTGYKAVDPRVETLEDGDEMFHHASGMWNPIRSVDSNLLVFRSDSFYRRKIKAPVKLVPVDFEHRDNIHGRRILVTWPSGEVRDFVAIS